MSGSREESPDWLRAFQAPTQCAVTLSSGSESSPNDSPTTEDEIDPKKLFLKDTTPVSLKNKDQDVVDCEGGKDITMSKTSKSKSQRKQPKSSGSTPLKKKKTDNRSKREGDGFEGQAAKQETSEEHVELQAQKHSVWTLSSDSESCPDNNLIKEDSGHHDKLSALKTTQYPEKENEEEALLIDRDGKSQFNEASKGKSPKKRLKTEDQIPRKKKKLNDHTSKKENDGDMEVAEEEIPEKRTEPHLSSSRLPLVLSEKVHRSKALVECEGDSIDLSGDMGSVGRVVISDNPSRSHEMFLDLKGTIYKSTIVSSRTFCVVSFGQSEAKIEAIMNDFIQLKPQSNFCEAETMVEGTLDGFSFDSEDETDKMPKASTHQTDENEGTEEKPNGKSKAKSAKLSGTTVRKRGKATGGKLPKKAKKKTQAPKKTKTKK